MLRSQKRERASLTGQGFVCLQSVNQSHLWLSQELCVGTVLGPWARPSWCNRGVREVSGPSPSGVLKHVLIEVPSTGAPGGRRLHPELETQASWAMSPRQPVRGIWECERDLECVDQWFFPVWSWRLMKLVPWDILGYPQNLKLFS